MTNYENEDVYTGWDGNLISIQDLLDDYKKHMIDKWWFPDDDEDFPSDTTPSKNEQVIEHDLSESSDDEDEFEVVHTYSPGEYSIIDFSESDDDD